MLGGLLIPPTLMAQQSRTGEGPRGLFDHQTADWRIKCASDAAYSDDVGYAAAVVFQEWGDADVIEENVVVVLKRGRSSRPLFITAAGMEKETAADYVKAMHGPYRIATMLRRAHLLSKTAAAKA